MCKMTEDRKHDTRSLAYNLRFFIERQREKITEMHCTATRKACSPLDFCSFRTHKKAIQHFIESKVKPQRISLPQKSQCYKHRQSGPLIIIPFTTIYQIWQRRDQSPSAFLALLHSSLVTITRYNKKILMARPHHYKSDCLWQLLVILQSQL